MTMFKVHETIFNTTSDGKPMTVLHKKPLKKEKFPAVVIFHDAPGIREAIHAFSQRLAGHGYDVFVPDLYHRHGRLIGFSSHDLATDPSAKPRMYELLAALTDDGIQQDLDVTLKLVDKHNLAAQKGEGNNSKQSNQVYCIGFCVGARAVFHTMMQRPEQFVAGAMWHPSFLVDDTPNSPHLTASEFPGSLYIGFGEADETMSVASMQPFIDAVAPLSDRVTIDIHPEADHAYTWPDTSNYNEAAAQKSWEQTLQLFEQTTAAANRL
ncbi:MAG: dienelactone hydrolase family protein [Acidimicrobiaceae bacterium]|nr:dienelactone hydrolase family protein [Acidimicrobiaceae bacterium]